MFAGTIRKAPLPVFRLFARPAMRRVPADLDIHQEPMHAFIDSLRPGPEPVPAGDYAMWMPSAGEPMFTSSETREHLRRLYETIAGIQTYVFGDLLLHLELIEQDTGRVKIPRDLNTFSILGPEDQVFILSVSEEKG